jgi:hypothetical protein
MGVIKAREKRKLRKYKRHQDIRRRRAERNRRGRKGIVRYRNPFSVFVTTVDRLDTSISAERWCRALRDWIEQSKLLQIWLLFLLHTL